MMEKGSEKEGENCFSCVQQNEGSTMTCFGVHTPVVPGCMQPRPPWGSSGSSAGLLRRHPGRWGWESRTSWEAGTEWNLKAELQYERHLSWQPQIKSCRMGSEILWSTKHLQSKVIPFTHSWKCLILPHRLLPELLKPGLRKLVEEDA